MTQTLVRVAADISTTLTTKTAVGATTGTLTSGIDSDLVQLPTGTYGFTVDRSSASKEHFTATLTGAALTNIQTVTRGTGVGTAGLLREHRKGAEVIITDWVSLKRMMNVLDGTTSFDSATPLGYDGTATISTANQLATKAYVDGVAIAGAADSSTTVKGIGRVSVAPVSAATPIFVGDNDGRVPTQAENDAMSGGGIFGAPSASNEFLTETWALNSEPVASFGSGIDGSVTFDGTNTFAFASKSGNIYTLTRDVEGTTIVINSGITINTANYIIGGKSSIANAGIIQNNANAGGTGVNNAGTTAAGGAAGAAIAVGTFAASIAGVVGGQGNGDAAAGGAGTTGIAATSVGSNGVAGGISGTSSGAQGAAGVGGTNTAETMSVSVGQNITPTTLTAGSVTTVTKVNRFAAKTSINNYTLSTSAGSGSGGGGPSKGGGGGGSGSTGGVTCLISLAITNTGTIQALGGNGGLGGNGTDATSGSGRLSGGGGGGGAGGNGGTIIFIYKTLTNSGTVVTTGGTAGAGGQPGGNGAGYGIGSAGSAGTAGSAGKIFYAQVNG